MDPSVQAVLDQYSKDFKLMCETLKGLQTLVETQGVSSSQNIDGNASINVGQHTERIGLQRVPFPKPLEVERGDLNENFSLFKANWNEYVIASGMDQWPPTQEKRKINMLLSFIGDEAKKKYSYFQLVEAEMTTVENVLKLIEERLVSKRSLLYDRFLFHECNQQDNENFSDYMVRLKKILDFCKFNENVTAETMLRDRIIFGIKDKALLKKFLAEDVEKLTLDYVQKECLIHEATEGRLKAMNHPEQADIKKIKAEKNMKRKCKFCAQLHVFQKDACPAFGKVCNYCKGNNHFEIACKKNPKANKTASMENKGASGGKKNHKKVKYIQANETESEEEEKETDDDEEYTVKIGKIVNKNRAGGPTLAKLDLKFDTWKKVDCEMDTGADVSVIGYKEYCELMQQKDPKLEKPRYNIEALGKRPIKAKGQVSIPCKRKGKSYLIVFQIIEDNQSPLLSENACLTLGLVKYCKKIAVNSKENLIKNADIIVQKYENVFVGLGQIPGKIKLEIDETVCPTIQIARRIPIALRNELKDELEQLERDGLIVREEQHTPWVSNLLIVKKEKGIRICLDPIPLNKALKRPHAQFTTLEEIIPELGKARVFSKLDAKKGFWQITLDDESSKLTTFWTPYGRFRWLRLPFGLKSAPEIFHNKIYEITHDLNGVEVMADDILVLGKGDTDEEAIVDHNTNLENLFIRLSKYNVKLNRSKLELCKTEVDFFGHKLTNAGLQPDKTKIKAIQEMPEPKSKEDVMRFLGMINYLGKFIHNLSAELSDLRRLCGKNVEFIWTKKERDEFHRLKRMISNISTLKYFEIGKPLIIECDASNKGLGAAVFQNNGIIGYASRTLKAPEKNYAMIEKEMLAIVFACTRFDQIIVGNGEVTIRTDHKPLVRIFEKPLLAVPKRLQMMLMSLQRYNIKIEHIAGKNNIVADALSRAPVKNEDLGETKKVNIFQIRSSEKQLMKSVMNVNLIEATHISDQLMEGIKIETAKDNRLQIVANYIVNGWPENIREIPDEVKIYNKYKSELSAQNGLIFRNEKILIPQELRRLVIEKIHVAHNGIENSVKLAKENVFWPNMSTEIKEKVQSCDICAKNAISQQNPPMQTHEVPVFPFQYVSMDVFFETIKGKTEKVLVTVDHYSDFFELDVLDNMSSKCLVETCKKNFSRHGIPRRVCTDRGTNFVSKEFADFSIKWNFEHVTSSPHHQQGNGKAEATVKIAKNLITKAEESQGDHWYSLLHLRNTPNKVNSSPVQRIFSRRTRTGLPSTTNLLKPKVVDNVSQDIQENRRKSKFYYDKKCKVLPPLNIGQPVDVQVDLADKRDWRKGMIHKQLKDRSFLVKVNDSLYQRSRVNIKPQQAMRPDVLADEKEKQHQPAATTPTNGKPTSEGNHKLPVQSVATHQTESIIGTSDVTSNARPRRDIRLPERLKDYIVRRE